MKKFIFRFEALLRYRKNRRDLCRQVLAQVLGEERRLIALRDELQRSLRWQVDEMRTLGRHGEVDVDRAASRRYYAGQLSVEIRRVEQNRDVVAQQLDLCRQTLLQADRDVKVLEKLETKQQAAFAYEEHRREQHEIEDAWRSARLTESQA